MSKIQSKNEWLQKRRKKRDIKMSIAIILMIAILIFSIFLFGKLLFRFLGPGENDTEAITETLSNGTVIQQHYLTPNEFSRPQTKLKRVKGVVIHYTANPGTSAKANRSYFEGLASKHTTYASSHYIVGLEGEVLQCIPLTEIAYASNNRNEDTISIECCHLDETGEFDDKTYDSLVALVAALSIKFNLKEEDIIRHYDVTGKLCPLYYVEHEEAWVTLKAVIENEIILIKSIVEE